MKSISTSKKIILSLKNSSVEFPEAKRSDLRSLFINCFMSPLQIFRSQKKVKTILENIFLEVYEGDRLGIIGRNGSGKTSLCRLITGYYGNQSTVEVNGDIRFIFNTEAFVQPELTVIENTALLLEIIYPKADKKSKKEMLSNIIDFANLIEHKEMPVKHLSAGMKARLYVSILTEKETDLLILDETLSTIDEFEKKKIIERILSRSKSTLFISHDTEFLKEVTNRTVRIHNKSIT